MSAPQTFKNHARIDPQFHLVIVPLLALNIGYSIYTAVHQGSVDLARHLWWIVMSVVFLLMAERSRAFALKAQDRVICLEERLRLASLLPSSEHSKISQLTPSQLIALRFASNQELPALTLRAVSQELDSKAIKQSVAEWRPDYHRV
ncbi:DUF6526 family protein [Granulicella sp. dw_53]|uniref:DUF6526 family protein n=1 Tax=Granulicella sp. dw_53 TaxID=2719792 RepID=UPI001BD258EE|nr:DUF6526 family protein [Granulicella sp. dw_53]